MYFASLLPSLYRVDELFLLLVEDEDAKSHEHYDENGAVYNPCGGECSVAKQTVFICLEDRGQRINLNILSVLCRSKA